MSKSVEENQNIVNKEICFLLCVSRPIDFSEKSKVICISSVF